jgi:carboxypeptidase PM20D1
MKLDDALAVATLIELKREGYEPRRDLVLGLSGDEETTMKTTQILAKELSNAEMVLNVDGTGGQLDPQGKPQYFTWSGAEKTYADFELTVTSPGGHSSRPYDPNAINQLAAALVRIGQYKFKPELSDLTRAYFVAAARYEIPEIAGAMHAFAADPTDSKAVATLRADPATVGKIGTTCIATMISGGHALNALPQRATANINCRIFPGHPRAEIMEELRRVAADAAVQSRMSPRAALQPTLPPFARMWLPQSRKPSTSAIRGYPYSPQCQRARATACGFAMSTFPATE